MNSSSLNRIPTVLPSLAYLEDLSLRDQSVFLLKRIAISVPWGKTFSKVDLFQRKGNRHDPMGLVQDFPWYQREIALSKLGSSPWEETVDAGYVAEAPPGSGRYKITHKGWVEFNHIVFGIEREDEDLPF